MKSWKVSDDSNCHIGLGPGRFGAAVTMYVEVGSDSAERSARSRPTGLPSPRVVTPSFKKTPS
jgi:hypothetical protein